MAMPVATGFAFFIVVMVMAVAFALDSGIRVLDKDFLAIRSNTIPSRKEWWLVKLHGPS